MPLLLSKGKLTHQKAFPALKLGVGTLCPSGAVFSSIRSYWGVLLAIPPFRDTAAEGWGSRQSVLSLEGNLDLSFRDGYMRRTPYVDDRHFYPGGCGGTQAHPG